MIFLKSLRYVSYFVSVLTFVCVVVVYLGKDFFLTYLPSDLSWLAPIIMALAIGGNQLMENKRVVRAEDLVHEEYKSEALSDDDIQDVLDSDPQLLNDEYEYRDDGA